MTIGLGIFGYGFIATAHLEGLLRIPEFAVRAVCGPNPERARVFATRFGIPHVTTEPLDLLTQPGIDGVLIDTPDRSHATLALLAVQHRKHIFCEKPLATSFAEAVAMTEAADRAGLRTLVGFSNRWNPFFGHVHQLISAGQLGRIYHVHAQSFNTGLLGRQPPFTWRTDPGRTGTGILGDLGAHTIDLLHFLLGPIEEVCASLRTCKPTLYDPETGAAHAAAVDDEALLLIRLRGGIEGTIALSRLGAEFSDFPVGHRQLLIGGEAAAVTYENGAGRLYRPDHTWELLPSDQPPEGLDHADYLARGTERILRTFLEEIQSGTDVGPTFRDGLRCQAVLEAAEDSARTHSWEPVTSVDSI
ncbi:MAG: Gfo/Idh/MocA family oxidoreductase [Chloroflexi bacterium]|nr:Gfo/Idh/MocA family oxidoreductase [Chloroflexota bacterium]